ncbi:hypothetical protein IWW36_002533 [Coemansia brasiliensis]|uniref:Uncharacterized protein n=1 Tax=Coemansia brasiliensis TaxID=2650707 RepID=A0A9W8I6Z6_9FUNG|nr:hypothetical protein IWW36_002533 [Coemansia brasiliensis]
MYQLRAQMKKYKSIEPLYRTNIFIQVYMNVNIPTLPSTIHVCINNTDTFGDVLNRIIDDETRSNAINHNIRFRDLRIWTFKTNCPMENNENVFARYSPSFDGSLFIQYNS